ncbi:MAG: class I SAM-dependent RNA methyltransferase [Lachnospiraceae bacterium]|jgi:putative N6-adenine-specific DNA methylase|nr:class I SAM-dependent RNA methyltransferase [Lachnospiraceae bacterium]
MEQWTLMAPCHFGLESVLKREIYDLGYEITEVQDGKVIYTGDPEAVCLSNIHLRTAERVLLVVGRFPATTFEELFQGIKEIQWEKWLPKNAKFWVTKASSVKSKLFSPSDIQSITKKAMVERMKGYYKLNWFPEDGPAFPLRIFIMKDEVTVTIDTTGASLHKRGYRTETGKAPISETLAAALIMLTPWHGDRILVDPFCGSGTFPIEAAMIAANMAPGMRRHFTAEAWTDLIPREMWTEAKADAEAEVNLDIETDIQGYDIDGDVVKIARQNARRAGVESLIHFQQRPLKELHHPKKYGFIITNPPYGERLEDKSALPPLYQDIGRVYQNLDAWSMFLITSYEDAERYIGKKAQKNRKIYNGMIKTYFYQFLGPKPPKKGKRP